jgi:chromosome segregation ATPase
MIRTIAMLKANLKGYEEAKQQMNQSIDTAVTESRDRADSLSTKAKDLETTLDKSKIELSLKATELKAEQEKVAQLEKSLASTTKILENKSSGADEHSAQLLKELTEARKNESAQMGLVMEKERRMSELQQELTVVRSEMSKMVAKVKSLETERDEERSRASRHVLERTSEASAKKELELPNDRRQQRQQSLLLCERSGQEERAGGAGGREERAGGRARGAGGESRANAQTSSFS